MGATMGSGKASLPALPTGQQQYMVVGRFVPNAKYGEAAPMCKVYRMKQANGQIISVNQIHEKKPLRVKNFGFWFRYESRTGTHNAYKEFRALKLTDAVNQLYQDMAGRSRAKSSAIQILK